MKHSETAFVSPVDAAKGIYRLRWFTPVTEVKLCGHATLATGYALFEEKKIPSDTTLTFQTLSGDLFVTKDKNSTRLQMNFPTSEAESVKLEAGAIEAIGKAMNFSPSDFIQSFYEPKSGTRSLRCYVHGTKTYIRDYEFLKIVLLAKLFLEVTSLAPILGLKSNSDALMAVKFGVNVRGVSVFTPNVKGSNIEGQVYDVASRYFAPWVGLHEDPVNGSSHTILGPLMAKRFGKNALLAYMASERTGVLGLKILDGGRILLEGDARTTLAGSMVLPN